MTVKTNTVRAGDGAARKYVNFDDYLSQYGVKEEIDIAVEKKLIAMKVAEAMAERGLNKVEFAKTVGTSRAQIDRILDPAEQNISLLTLKRAALALGKRLQIAFVDP